MKPDSRARIASGMMLIAGALCAAPAHAEALGPVSLGGTAVVDVLSNLRGGLNSGTRVLDKLDATATVAPPDGPLNGWTAFLDVQATDATGLNDDLVGSLQGVSNIDAPAGLRILDAFVGRDDEGVGGFKAGIIDLNSEFDVQPTGVLFLNPSHGIGPDFSQSGDNGPSIFPNPGLGIVAHWLPGEHWDLKAGIFEGTAGDPAHPGRESIALTGREGALLVGEIRNRTLPHLVIGAGAWSYTSGFATLDGRTAHGNAGAYILLDGKLIVVEGHDEQGLSAWLRFGFANTRINPVSTYAGGGLVYAGIFGENDQAGLAVGHVRLGDDARDAAALAGTSLGGGENAIEATYSAAVTDWLTLQPDLQYLISPGADPTAGDAIVAGARITLTWN